MSEGRKEVAAAITYLVDTVGLDAVDEDFGNLPRRNGMAPELAVGRASVEGLVRGPDLCPGGRRLEVLRAVDLLDQLTRDSQVVQCGLFVGCKI